MDEHEPQAAAALHALLARHSEVVKGMDGDAAAALAAMPLPRLTPLQEGALAALALGQATDPLPLYAVCRVREVGALRGCFTGLTAHDLAALEAAVDYLQLPVTWAEACAQEAAARAAAAQQRLPAALQPLLTAAARATEASLVAAGGRGVVVDEAALLGRGWDTVAAAAVRVCEGAAPPPQGPPPRGCAGLRWCEVAAAAGNVAAFRWAFGAGCDWWECSRATEAAARHGHLAVLEEAVRLRCTILPYKASCAAALGGHTRVLEWFREHDDGSAFVTWTCASAATGGHLATLQWLRQPGLECAWDEWTCSNAAGGGHLAVLQWARRQGCPWDDWTCAQAAEGGHIDVLQWARREGCPWSESTCSRAAASGRLTALQWARREGCPWDEWTCTRAARAGHLDVLQWARQEGCPWDANTCKEAARGGHVDVLHWAAASGAPLTDEDALFEAAGEGGHLAAVSAWLDERAEWLDACAAAAGGPPHAT